MSRRVVAAIAVVSLCAGASGCATPLDRVRSSYDASAPRPRRIGFVTFAGPDRPTSQIVTRALQDAVCERMASTGVEIAATSDEGRLLLASLERGGVPPGAVLAASARYGVDAICVGRITRYRSFPPQAIGLEIALVSASTGQVIWNALGTIDAADPVTQEAARGGFYQTLSDLDPVQALDEFTDPEAAFLTLESPEAFAAFAARVFAQAARPR